MSRLCNRRHVALMLLRYEKCPSSLPRSRNRVNFSIKMPRSKRPKENKCGLVLIESHFHTLFNHAPLVRQQPNLKKRGEYFLLSGAVAGGVKILPIANNCQLF